MKKLVKSLALASVCVLLAACSSNPPEVITVAPTIAPIKSGKFANNKIIAVRVIGLSGNNLIGSRTGQFSQPVDIYVDSTLPTVVTQAVFSALQQYGFDPVPADSNEHQSALVVNFSALNYNSNGKVVYNSVAASAIFTATAFNDAQTYQYTYTGTSSWITTTSNVDNDTQYVNKAVSEALNNMLHDQNLINFLAR
jgi:uncharacterized lipoprotein YajG